jgi:hypothetical protein
MYHPAAALHQQSLRQVILDDFASIPSVLERARQMRAPSPGSNSPGTNQANPASTGTPAPTVEQIRLFE